MREPGEGHVITAWVPGDGASGHRPRDVYAYFDNDALEHAPHDAAARGALLSSRG